MKDDYHISRSLDLHTGRGKLARQGGAYRRLAPEQWVEVFLDGLRVVEDATDHTQQVRRVG